MRPIDPAEISALLDGELPPDRAEEVRRAIAADESLRRVYCELSAMDAELKASAAQAVFQPHLVLPETASNYGFRIFLAAVALVLARVVMKLSSPELAAGLAMILLAVVIGWVLWFSERALDSPSLVGRG
jgi:anti-sigma factor RsiW